MSFEAFGNFAQLLRITQLDKPLDALYFLRMNIKDKRVMAFIAHGLLNEVARKIRKNNREIQEKTIEYATDLCKQHLHDFLCIGIIYGELVEKAVANEITAHRCIDIISDNVVALVGKKYPVDKS